VKAKERGRQEESEGKGQPKKREQKWQRKIGRLGRTEEGGRRDDSRGEAEWIK